MFNASRASANSIINRVMSNANGIGQSKSEARANSGLKGANGHNVSDKAHSIKEVQNMRSVTTQFVNFVNENYDGKVANNINADSAKAFLEAKAQEISGGSLNTYVSTMNKIADNLQKDGIGDLSREVIQDIKSDLKEAYSLHSEHINRAYEDTQAIKDEMQNTPYALSADLQHEAGLRADDAINSGKWSVNEDNTLTVHDSKGGIDYTTTHLSDELIQRVGEAIENGYNANYSEYRETLKEAVEATGQEWSGTHGLRYNFAQERVEELRENGHSEDEARGITSLEMGHSRLDITDHYTTFQAD
jgi:hypothetical protein